MSPGGRGPLNPLCFYCGIILSVTAIRNVIIAAVICLGMGLQACQNPAPRTDTKLRVLTTIAPLYSFTKNVAGDTAHVENLLPSGAGPHEYSFSPADVRKAAKADLLVKNGVNLESWMQKLTTAAEEVRASSGLEKGDLYIVDTSEGVEILGMDPHIWLSPKNAVLQVNNIKDALIMVDPDNSELYRRNAEGYIQRLNKLDREIRDEISSWKMRQFISFHSAFQYFAGDYGLEQVAVIQQTPETEPSPRHIAHVIETVRSKGIPSIFTEPGTSHKIVTSLAEDLKLKVYSLDTLETGLLSGEWYEEKMRENMAVLKRALNRGAE